MHRVYKHAAAIAMFDRDVNAKNFDLYNVKQISAKTINANQVNLNEQGDFYSGFPSQITYGELITESDLLALRSDGKFYKADLNLAGDIVLAIAVKNGLADEVHSALLYGVLNRSDFNFTAGQKLYLGETPGSLVTAPPVNYDEQLVGFALSPTKIVMFSYFVHAHEHAESSISFDSSEGHSHTGIDSRKIDYPNLKNIPNAFTPTAHDNSKHSTNYESAFSKNQAFNKNFGTTAGSVCEGDDSRLSDDRTPTAHDNSKHSTNYEPAFSKNQAFNKNFGTTAGSVCEGDDSRLSDDRTPTTHDNNKHSTNYEPEITTKNSAFNKNFGQNTGEVCEGNDGRLLSSAQKTDLTDNGESTLHYHNSDRNRANHTGSQTHDTISDFDTEVDARISAQKGGANGIATLGADSKIPNSQLPPLAISETFSASSEVEQLALTIQEGDVCVRTDLNKSYIALNGNNTTMADWQELLTPTDAVQSVDGKTGVVDLSNDYEPKFTKNSAFNKNFGQNTGEVCEGNDSRLSDDRTPTTHDNNKHSTNYEPAFSKNQAFNKNFGTTAGSVCEGDDSRLSDDRTPTTHDNNKHSTNYEPAFSKNQAFNKNFGTNAGEVAEGNHTHNQITELVDDTTPQLGGFLDLNNKPICSKFSSHGLTAGKCAYMNGSSPAHADADSESTMPAFGIVYDANHICIGGVYTTSGLTAGDVYYVGTDGNPTNIAPSGTGDQVQRIGLAISTTKLLVNPSLDVMEV